MHDLTDMSGTRKRPYVTRATCLSTLYLEVFQTSIVLDMICFYKALSPLSVVHLAVQRQAPPVYFLQPFPRSSSSRSQATKQSVTVQWAQSIPHRVLTTFFTLPSDSFAAPVTDRQSSGRYGASITTRSLTTISLPSHRVGSVRLIRSKMSCASLLTPLPFFASSAFRRETVASRRDCKALWSSGGRGAAVAPGDGSETTEKFWRAERGRIW